MSERLTTIDLPGTSGLQEWGYKTPEEMIAKYRRYAEYRLQEAQRILATPDEDFHVYTHTGVHVVRNRRTLQEGKH